MRLSSRWIVRCSAVVLALGLGMGTAYGAPPADDAGASQSAAGMTVPLFTGKVLTPDGAPAAGVDVLLLGWPGADALAHLREGDDVGVSPIGQTRTAADGTYTLSVDRPALASWYGKKARGQVQVEVSATAPGMFGTFDATVDYHPGQGRVEVLPASGVSDGGFEGRRGAQRLDLTLQASDLRSGPAPAAGGGDFSAAAVIGYACYQYHSDLGRQGVTVGQLSAQTTSYSGSYTYTSGVTNTLGAGHSGSGAYGSWTASGTRTIASSTSLGFGSVASTGTANFRTEVRYGKYYGTGCSPSSVFYYKAYPSEWIGSVVTSVSSVSPSATYCASVTSGNTLTQNRSVSTTVSAGVSSAPVLGISLSSQAGWSTSAAMKVTLRKNGSVCGTTGYPGSTTSSAGRLVVK